MNEQMKHRFTQKRARKRKGQEVESQNKTHEDESYKINQETATYLTITGFFSFAI